MIVFDLDNTLRLTKGDYPYTPFALKLEPTADNWLTWQDYVNANGKPIVKMCELYVSLLGLGTELTAILTSSQHGTRDWLSNHGLPPPSFIIERQPGDNRSSFDMKVDWVTNQAPTITLWIDDDTKMCDYVESLGIPVVRVTKLIIDKV